MVVGSRVGLRMSAVLQAASDNRKGQVRLPQTRIRGYYMLYFVRWDGGAEQLELGMTVESEVVR